MSHHEKKVTQEMSVIDALKHNPNTAKVFMSHGMHCLGCASAKGETIAQAAMVHGLNLDNLLVDLNNA